MTDDIPSLEHVCAPLTLYCQPANIDPALALGRAKILETVEHAISTKKSGKRPAPGASAVLYFTAWMRSRHSMDFLPLSEAGYVLSCHDYIATVKHIVRSEAGLYVVNLRIEESCQADAVLTAGMARLLQKKFSGRTGGRLSSCTRTGQASGSSTSPTSRTRRRSTT